MGGNNNGGNNNKGGNKNGINISYIKLRGLLRDTTYNNTL